jgi:hypothetical protein
MICKSSETREKESLAIFIFLKTALLLVSVKISQNKKEKFIKAKILNLLTLNICNGTKRKESY